MNKLIFSFFLLISILTVNTYANNITVKKHSAIDSLNNENDLALNPNTTDIIWDQPIDILTSHDQVTPTLLSRIDEAKMIMWVDSVFDKLSLDQKIGQLFMPIVDGSVSQSNKNLIKKYINDNHIGGILFSKSNAKDQLELTNHARSLSKIPLFISLDGEWGLAMRITDAPRFPKNMMLGAIQNDSLIQAYGAEVGRQCKIMGININFAPVLDINSNPKNPVIGTRSFGEDKKLVSKKGIRYAKGIESRGVMAVGKHFPGHGDTSDDSHHTLPLLAHSKERMYDFELSPFKDYIDNKFSGMLTAHLSVPSLDKTGQPSSLSPAIVTGILKEELGFSGLVFTDGLAMKGVSGDPDHSVKALLAGNDILLGSANVALQYNKVKNAVASGKIPISLIEEKSRKVLKYKYITGATRKDSISSRNILNRLNTESTDNLNRQLHQNAITLLKDNNEIIPLRGLDKKDILSLTIGSPDKGAFTKTLSKYTTITNFDISANISKEEQIKITDKAKNSNLIIVGISATKSGETEFLKSLCRGKEYILVFFTSPYRLSSYKSLIAGAQGVILAYENSPLAGEYAAQLIFGGIPAKGKLPVTIPGLFKAGTGLQREKTRLGYVNPLQENMNPKILAEIDSLMLQAIAEGGIPGGQILVARNGNVVYDKSFGYFDFAKSKEVEFSDIYDLASVTKGAATVPAMMLLRDEYRIKTTNKLSDFVKELKGTNKENLSFRDALFHETGLPGGYPFYRMAIDQESLNNQPFLKSKRDINHRLQADQNLYAYTDYKYQTDLVSDHQTAKCPLQVAKGFYISSQFNDSILTKISTLPLRKKGTYTYSCLNFVLLKSAIENISHKGLDEYLTTKLYAPLGANTLIYNPAEKFDNTKIAPTENDKFLRKQMLVGYVHDEIAAFSGGIQGNAGLFGNSNDLAKLVQLFLNNGEYGGERLLSEETVKLYTLTRSGKSRRGLGFDKPDIRNPSSSPSALQASASSFGHTGFTGTIFWADPETNLIYILLTNRVYPNRWNRKFQTGGYRTTIQEKIYDAINEKK